MLSLNQIKDTLQSTGKYWIVFTGDSITSCEWVHPNWRDIVIYALQEEMTKVLHGDWKTATWNMRGFNLAYDGATTKDIKDRIHDIVRLKPDLVISLMGGNDPVLGVSVEQSIQYIANITKTVTHTGAQLVWSSSTPAGKGSKKNSEYAPYAQAFLKAELPGVIKVDMFNRYQHFPTEKFFTFISEGKPDLQHPNQLGNAYIAKIILGKVFTISFDPEKYIRETLEGNKYPEY